MKKIIISSLIACAYGSAYANVQIYGLMDAAISIGNNGSGKTIPRLDSGVGPGTRIGFRGTEDLGGGLKAGFTAEMGIDSGTGNFQQGNLPFGRQIFMGLSNANWNFTMGRQQSPSVIALAALDVKRQAAWNSSAGFGIGNMSTAANSSMGAGCQGATMRINNSAQLAYSDKSTTARFMVGFGDENGNRTGQLINPSIHQKVGNATLIASYVKMRQCQSDFKEALTNPSWQSEKVLGLNYDFGSVTAHFGWYNFDPSEDNKTVGTKTLLKQDAFFMGLRVPIKNQSEFLVQVSKLKAHYPTFSGNGYGLGVTYLHFLSKRTRVYVSGGYMKNDENGSFFLGGATAAQTAGAPGANPRVISIGITHSF